MVRSERFITVLACFTFLFLFPSSKVSADTYEILWSVENRFKLFDYLTSSAQESAQLLAKYAKDNNVGTSTDIADYNAIATLGSPLILNGKINPNSPWEEANQRYMESYARVDRPTHRVSFSLNSPPVDGTCKWSLKGVTKKPEEKPCGEPFKIDGVPSEFKVTVEINGEPQISLNGEVKERRIVAIGDSYGSGEGNPDLPSKWENGMKFKANDATERHRSLSNVLERRGGGAVWWDQRCHRSFWSNQMFAALSISLSDPHSVSTFLPYSCSGAEVFDGLVMPQMNPPGKKKQDSYSPQKHSQISAVAQDLCESGKVKKVKEMDVVEPGEPWTKKEDKGKYVKNALECTNGAKIDTLLLSIGGNDIGFSHVVAWALVPAKTESGGKLLHEAFGHLRKRMARCPSDYAHDHQNEFGACERPDSETMAKNGLSDRYNDLNKALETQLKLSNSTKVFVTAYPDPLHDGKGDVCDKNFSPDRDSDWRKKNKIRVQAGWDAISYLIPLDAREWGFNITPGEVEQVSVPVIGNLNRKMFEKAWEFNWNFVDEHLEMYRTHGWCAMTPNESVTDFVISGVRRHGKDGIPPSNWKAYESRGRWLRTINDAVLTQWPDEDYEGGSAGSFHPTAEGHYATGKAVSNKWKWVSSRIPKQP